MATINDIGIPNWTGILQPKQKNKWRVTFTGLGGGTNSQNVTVQAITVSRPSFSFEKIQLDRYNSRAWIAGKYTFEPMKLTVEDDVTSAASQVIQDQVDKQQWLIGAQGAWLATANEGSIYKFATLLDMLDGNEQIIETWTMEGCWFQQVEYTDLDYASSDAVKIDLTIQYDNARQLIKPFGPGEGVALGGPGGDGAYQAGN